jgi:hypothetical protein
MVPPRGWCSPRCSSRHDSGPARWAQHQLGIRLLLVIAFEAERSDGPLQLRLGLLGFLDGVLPNRELQEVELIDGPTLHHHILDVPDPDILPARRRHRWEQREPVQVDRHPGAVRQEPQLSGVEQPTHGLLPLPHGGDLP